MAEHTNTPDLASLLANASWLQRLAAHLVGGNDGADDAVQETWVAALRSSPDRPDALRPWLGQVLRNAVRRRARSEGRRRSREAAVVPTDPHHAAEADALETLELQRRLTELVAALDEPYRATVVLRYFEGKTSREIGQALGVPDSTVRWRLRHALDRLRRDLDERNGGDRQAWCVALLPLAHSELRPRGAAGTLGLGGVALLGAILVVGGVIGARLTRVDMVEGPGGAGRPSGAPPRLVGATVAIRAAVLEGLVVDEQGRSVDGARVTAWQHRPPRGRTSWGSPRFVPNAVATTAGGGRFRLSGPFEGKVAIGASHPRLGSGGEKEAQVGTSIRIELSPRGPTLSGEIADEGGGPIAGARVTMGAGGVLFQTVSDAGGAYRLGAIGLGSTAYVEADGYAPTGAFLKLDMDDRRDFRLAPGARVSGRVVTGDDKNPVPGAEVRLIPTNRSGPSRWEESATTDANGAFTMNGLPAGEFRIHVHRERLVTHGERFLTPTAGGTETIEIALQEGVDVRGRLRSPDGRPIAEAGVNVVDGGPDQRTQGALAAVMTGADGRFLLEGVPRAHLRIRISASGYTAEDTSIDTSQPPKELDLTIEPVGVLRGGVVKPDGRPAVGAQVRARSRAPGATGGRLAFAKTDPNGRFEAVGLGQGDAVVTATHDHDVALLGPFSVQKGERKEVKLVLARGAVVSGTVRWDDGAPAAAVGVHAMARPPDTERVRFDLMPESVRTDKEGRFTIGPFLPGKAIIVAVGRENRVTWQHRDRPEERVVPIAGAEAITGIDLVVSRGLQRLAGVVSSPTGKPLGGVTLVADREIDGYSFKKSSSAVRTTSAGDGSFAIEGLGRAKFCLWAEHPDYADLELRNQDAGATDLRLRFPKPAVVSGVLVTRAGRPVPQYSLVVIPVAPAQETHRERDRREGNWDHRHEISEVHGAFVLRKLPPGRYDFTANTPDGLLARSHDVAITEGESRRLRLVAEPGGVVIGRVVEEGTDKPIADARISVLLPGIRSRETTADGGGAFRLTGVPPGPKVRISVGGIRDVHSSRRFETDIPGPLATVDLGTVRLSKNSSP